MGDPSVLDEAFQYPLANPIDIIASDWIGNTDEFKEFLRERGILQQRKIDQLKLENIRLKTALRSFKKEDTT